MLSEWVWTGCGVVQMSSILVLSLSLCSPRSPTGKHLSSPTWCKMLHLLLFPDDKTIFECHTIRCDARLASYGIRGHLLSWIQEYLCGSSHCTRIGVAYSMLACMLSGIIQGSVIGPLLFLIFLNDLVELLASVGITVKVFADDMKIYIRVTSNIDVRRWQTALDLVTEWAQAWQLQVSVDKLLCVKPW